MNANLELPIEFDAAAAVRTAAAASAFDRLGAEDSVALPVLGGGELCMLGGLRTPFLWAPLADRWRSLPRADRARYITAMTGRLARERDLTELPPAGGKGPAARYGVSPELGIVLAARAQPRFAVTSYFSGALAPLSFFAVDGESAGSRGIVMAVQMADPAPGGRPRRPRYVTDVFAHVLVTDTRAAGILADWVIQPAPARRRSRPPRRVSLLRPGGQAAPVTEFSVLGNGTTARVDGLATAGELDRHGLQQLLQDLFAQGAAAP